MSFRLLISFAAAVFAFAPSLANAQAFIEHIAPPVIESGKTTRVEFVGRDLAGALDVWKSLPTGAIRAKLIESNPTHAVFDLTVAKDADVGICGVRVATRDGLSNAHMFLVDDLPVRTANAGKLELPAAVWGTFREATVDRYQITVPAGRLSFEIVGSRFGKDADPLVTIRDPHGKIVTEHDNDPGLYFDSRFEHEFKVPGTYTVEVREARFRGSEHHQYVLRIGKFAPETVAVPSAIHVSAGSRQPGAFFETVRRPGDDGSSWLPMTSTEGDISVAKEVSDARTKAWIAASSPATTLGFNFSPLRANPFLSLDAIMLTGRAQATFAKVPGVLCGVLRQPNERHSFLFELAKGQRISVRGEAKSLNSPADLEMVLTDRVGREQRRGQEKDNEVTLDFTAQTAGHYGLTVRDQLRDGGNSFAYRLTVVDGSLPPTLLTEVEGLTIPQGSYQPIPITIARNGVAGPIKLSLVGAPAGVTLSPNVIDEKDTAVVCKLEASEASPIGVHFIQILADSSAGRILVQTQPLIDKQIINIDLIPLALREDQKRLPPSLADRLALQITPPAPFSFELPEKAITLARYQKAGIPVMTTRVAGFDGLITFTAKGGQLADKHEGRTRVYADFPEATPAMPNLNGVIVSKILSNIGRTRIEVSAHAVQQNRRVTLTRTFELNLTTAFTVKAEPTKVSLFSGETAKVRVQVERVKTFAGDVAIQLSPVSGLQFPEGVVVPKGQNSVEIEVRAAADAQPGQHNQQFHATARVDGFEEEMRAQLLTIEVKTVEPPKKK